MHFHKKLLLFLLVFSMYAHAADQDLSPRASIKRARTEGDLSQEFYSPKKVKRNQVTIDCQNLDLVQRDNLFDLEPLKEKLRSKTEQLSTEDIEENMRVVATRKRMAAQMLEKDRTTLEKTCNDLKAMLLWQKHCREYPHTFFSNPRDTAETKLSTYLTGIIHHARDEIKIACYHIAFFPVAQAVVDRYKAGVIVSIITNKDQGNVTSAVNFMKRNGISLFVPKKSSSLYCNVHCKFFIFKNILGKKLVVTGSYNPTGSADKNEWNDLHITDHNKTFAQYTKQFNEMVREGCVSADAFEGKYESLLANTQRNYDKNKQLTSAYNLNQVPQEERRLFEQYPNPVGPANRIQSEDQE